MRPLVNRWRRWSRRPLLFAPDPQRPAPQPQCFKIRRRLRGKTAVGQKSANVYALAVGGVRVTSQRRRFSITTANVTSWGSGRHYLQQERPSLVVIQEHILAHTDSNSSRNIDYVLLSPALAHRLESVELSRGPLRPHSPVVSTYRAPVAPSLCEPVCGPRHCARMASNVQHVLLPLLIGLLFVRASMRRERTLLCPGAGAGGSAWRRLRHWTFAMCMASIARHWLVEVKNCVSHANI